MSATSTPQPLRLADGTLIGGDGSPIDFGEQLIAAHEATQELVAPVRELTVSPNKRLAELPDTTRVMNAISAVLGYELYGLSATDTAVALNLSPAQVAQIKEHGTYTTMRLAIIENIFAAEAGNVRQVFQQNSRLAAQTLITLVKNAKGKTADKIAVAKDILDRGGHRPADIVEHRHRLEGGLVIEIIRKDVTNNLPTIDVEL